MKFKLPFKKRENCYKYYATPNRKGLFKLKSIGKAISDKSRRLIHNPISRGVISIRQIAMIVSLILITANYFTAPLGVLVLSSSIAYDFYKYRKMGKARITIKRLFAESIFFLPGAVLVISSLLGAIWHGNYFSAIIAVTVLAPILFCATLIQFLWKKIDVLNFARYSVMFIIPTTIFDFLYNVRGFVDYDNLGLRESMREYMRLMWESLVLKFEGNMYFFGTFTNQNYFAYFLEIALIMSLALFYHIWKKNLKVVVILSFLVGTCSLFLTESRSGYFAFLAGVFIFLFVMSERVILTFSFAIITSLLVYAAIFPETITSIFYGLVDGSDQFSLEMQVRMDIWKEAIRQINQSPLIGTGLFSFNQYISADAQPTVRNVVHAHNIFLNFWVETGLTGLLAFVLIIARSTVYMIKRLKTSYVRPLYAAGLAIIGVTVVHGITDAILVSSQTIALFGLYIGMMTTKRD